MYDGGLLETCGSGVTAWRLGDLAFDVEAEVERAYAAIDAPTDKPLSAAEIAGRWLGSHALEHAAAKAFDGLGDAHSYQLPAGAWRIRVSTALDASTANGAVFGELAYVWLLERRLLVGLSADEVDRSCEALGRGLSLPKRALDGLLSCPLWRLAWDLGLPARHVALRVAEAFDRNAAVVAAERAPELRGAAESWRDPRVGHPNDGVPNCLRVDLWDEAGGALLIRHPLIIRLDFGAYMSYCPSTSLAGLAAVPGGTERGLQMSNAAAAAEPRRRFMSLANVTDEPDRGPQATILHGPPGVGKTTFVADAPDCIFLCSERGLKALGPRRLPHFPYPTSLRDVYDAVDELVQGKHAYRHLVIDSIDWVETLIQARVCAENHVPHMETQDYKKLYTAAMPFVNQLLRMLDALRDRRQMHVWLVAHSVQVKVSNHTGETWDKWELKLDRRVAERLREWADNVLFADFVTDVVKGGKGKRAVGKMKGRALYTMESADHFAKNRNHLPEKLPLSFKALQTAFNEKRQAPDAAMKARLEDLLDHMRDDDRVAVEREIETYRLDDPRRLAMILTMAETIASSYGEEEDASGVVERAELNGASAEAPANDVPDDDELTPAEGTPVAETSTELTLDKDDPAWEALARTAIARIDDASDEASLEETLRQVKVVELPRPLGAQVMAAAFRWRIARAGSGSALDTLVGDIRAAKLPDAVKKSLAEAYTGRRKALAGKDAANAARS